MEGHWALSWENGFLNRSTKMSTAYSVSRRDVQEAMKAAQADIAIIANPTNLRLVWVDESGNVAEAHDIEK